VSSVAVYDSAGILELFGTCFNMSKHNFASRSFVKCRILYNGNCQKSKTISIVIQSVALLWAGVNCVHRMNFFMFLF